MESRSLVGFGNGEKLSELRELSKTGLESLSSAMVLWGLDYRQRFKAKIVFLGKLKTNKELHFMLVGFKKCNNNKTVLMEQLCTIECELIASGYTEYCFNKLRKPEISPED